MRYALPVARCGQNQIILIFKFCVRAILTHNIYLSCIGTIVSVCRICFSLDRTQRTHRIQLGHGVKDIYVPSLRDGFLGVPPRASTKW